MALPLNQLHPSSVRARLRAVAAPVPRMGDRRAEVLVYHGVTEGMPLKLNTRFVLARRLRGDIRALRRIAGLRFVSLAEAMDPDVPGPKIALTFDDGYRGMLQTLLPVLEAEGVPACLFITTLDAHDMPEAALRILWTDRIDIAAHQGHPVFSVGAEQYLLDLRRIWRREGDGYPLKSLCIERDVAFLDVVAAASSPAPDLRPYWELLTSDDLRFLAAHPLITLGAHGVTHANLPSLSEAARWRELPSARHGWRFVCSSRSPPSPIHTGNIPPTAWRASSPIVTSCQMAAASWARNTTTSDCCRSIAGPACSGTCV